MAIKFLSNESIDGTLEVGSFTVSGSGIVAAVGMTLQVDAGGVNAITIDNVGTVTTSGYLKIPNYLFHDGDTDTRLQFGTGTITLRGDSGITLDGPVTTNAAFNLTGGIITLGVADTSSGHINAYENLTFNIDIDNDDTNRYFGFYTNGSDGSGTELVRIAEDGNVAIQPGGATLTNTRLYVVSADNYDPSLYDGMGGIRIGSGGGSSAGDGNYTGGIGFAITSGTSGIAGVQKGADADKQGLAFFTHPSNTGGDAAVEKMRLDADGNVGIGTSSPDNKLQVVAGNAQVQAWFGETGYTNASIRVGGDNAAGGRVFIQYVGDDSYIDSYGGHGSTQRYRDFTVGARNIRFVTGNTSGSEKMRITSDGNVGIAATPPTNGYTASGGGWKMLQIGQSSQIAAYGTDDEIGIFQNTYLNSSGVFQAITSNVAGSSIILVDGKIYFKTATTSGTAQTTSTSMFIDTTGNVGIGTDSPTFKLEVKATTTNTAVFTTSNTVTCNTYFGHTSISNNTNLILYSNGGNVQMWKSGNSSSGWGGTKAFNVYNSDGVIAFHPSGNDNKLVVQNSAQSLRIKGGSATGNNYMQFVNNAGTNQGYFGYGGSSNILYIVQQVAGDIVFYTNSAIRGSISQGGTLTMGGDVVAYGSPSDKRLKENIKPVKSALDKVSKLQGVTFDWKDKKQNKAYDPDQGWKHDIGFIAQDVQKVIPELVRENEDGMLSMRHQGIAPILLEAIKELKAEIEELKKQIKQ